MEPLCAGKPSTVLLKAKVEVQKGASSSRWSLPSQVAQLGYGRGQGDGEAVRADPGPCRGVKMKGPSTGTLVQCHRGHHKPPVFTGLSQLRRLSGSTAGSHVLQSTF